MDDLDNSTHTTPVKPTALGSTELLAVSEETGRGPYPKSLGSPAGVPQFKAGDLIDNRFVVIRFIARGGMGEVFEVEDRQLRGVHVALKTILSQYAVDPAMRQRLEREVLSAREVVHPNLCPIYDLGHWNRPGGGLTYLTMKLLPGESLAARISRIGPISGEEALCLLTQVGAGIAAAHDAGILHRDIKTANIIVRGSGAEAFAWVTDFGLARPALSEETTITLQGVAGTPRFMAPELFHGAAPTKASDVYALGVVAYQALTGRLPQSSSWRRKSGDGSFSTAEIPEPWRRFVGGCLRSAVEKRYQTVSEAMQALPSTISHAEVGSAHAQRISRRKMLGLGASVSAGATAAVLAGGGWLEREQILDWLRPLPKPLHVALLAWPNGTSMPEVRTVLDSISQHLARAEAYVKGLLIISINDLPAGQAPPKDPSEAPGALGANLVLAASLRPAGSAVRLTLQVLEASTQRVLRYREVFCAAGAVSSLAKQAPEEAAAMLGLPKREKEFSDQQELQRVAQDVFQAFSEAEQLQSEPNHAGLKAAILKYERAVDLDPHFALGFAKLSIAYSEQYRVTREAANLQMARANAANALRFNPNSAKGLLSEAVALLYSGKSDEALTFFAKALMADPGNPETLILKARALMYKAQWDEAMQVFRDILAVRPNYWPAYNDVGDILDREAKYAEAAEQFKLAATVAPEAALPLANLGMAYLSLGQRDEARRALHASLDRAKNEDAYLALGDLDFEDGKYEAARANYLKAADIDPNYDLIQRNLGDCYAMLGDKEKVKESYKRAARLLSDQLATNPQDGFNWATLAFYQAKTGDFAHAELDIRNADAHGATDVESRFMVTQALVLMGKKKEALDLLLWCMDKGLSPEEVNAALDLKELRKDPRYTAQLNKPKG